MDPVTAIGVASAVVQFVQFGLQIANRLNDFNKAHPGEVPKSLVSISIQLPLLLNALKRIKTDSEINALNVDDRCILRGVVSGCHSQVSQVESMINELARAPGDTFSTKVKKVFKSMHFEEKLNVVEKNLQTYISVLILHHVVDSQEIPLQPAEETFFDVREKMVEAFIERPKPLKALDDALHDVTRSQTKTPIIITLVGPKGAGKSQLALAYCYQAHSLGQFKTVFWLDASSVENLYLGFESIYATITRSISGTREEKIRFAREFLNDLWHPWLLVIDNYESAAVYDHIMDLLPSRGTGGIMMIVRSDVGAKNDLGSIVEVPKFVTKADQLRLDSLLQQAVQPNKDFEKIKEAVEAGANVNTLIWDQWPVLHRCALFGLRDAVEYLLDKGAEMSVSEVAKPLYWAAMEGHESTCRVLLDHEDKKDQVSGRADLQAAFDAATDKDSPGIMSLLIDRCEKANLKLQYGEALYKAASKGNSGQVRLIVGHDTLKEDPTQADKAFIGAAAAGHFEILKSLNPYCSKAARSSALYSAVGLKNDARQESGVEIVEFLLENGADPNMTHGNGCLGEAAVHEHMKIMQLLLRFGANPTKDHGGWDPLTNAIKYNSAEAVKVLLETKITDAEARQDWLDAALRYACRKGDREYVLQVLQAGARIDAVEKTGLPKGASPLLLAVLGKHVKAAQLLVRRGAKQDVSDDQGRFPLAVAAENGFDTLVRDMIRAGGDPNFKSGSNQDPLLILAAGKKQDKLIQVLLDNGADRTLENKFGDMALDAAEEAGCSKETIKLLQG